MFERFIYFSPAFITHSSLDQYRKKFWWKLCRWQSSAPWWTDVLGLLFGDRERPFPFKNLTRVISTQKDTVREYYLCLFENSGEKLTYYWCKKMILVTRPGKHLQSSTVEKLTSFSRPPFFSNLNPLQSLWNDMEDFIAIKCRGEGRVRQS